MVININWKVWSVRIIIFVAIFGYLSWTFMDEEDKEKLLRSTNVTKRMYDYFDYKKYQDDLEDIVYFGTVQTSIEGDTTGLGLNQKYLDYVLRQRYFKYFDDVQYYDYGKILSATSESEIDSTKLLDEREIGVMWMNYHFTQLGSRVYVKMELIVGHEEKREVFFDDNFNLWKKRYIKKDMTRFNDLMVKGFAKRFFKIKKDPEQLKFLYRSVFHQ